MVILYILIGLIIGSIGIYLIVRPKLKITAQHNAEIEQENLQLLQVNNTLKENITNAENQLADVNISYDKLSAQREILKESIADLQEQSAAAAKTVYASALEVAQASFDKEIDNLSTQLEENRINCENIYKELAKDCVAEFEKSIYAAQQELTAVEQKLVAEKNNVNIAIAAAKRKQEIENQKDFYRICLSNEDIAEIKKLREVLPYLRDKTPLNKVIYKVYYEKPLTDMIGRVVGSGIHTGIYKITNLIDGRCYVGQAASISDRWKQHAKRGVGAEDWTQNKLYPAMYAIGIENFTFEIIEECDRAQLNEREDYWQDFFEARSFGYSIK